MNKYKRFSIGLFGVACAVCGIVGLSNLSFKSAQNSAYAYTEDVEITSNTACDFGVQNKDCVILQTEQAHFTKNELIVVDYRVYSEYGITDFDYEVDGIEVDNVNIENLSVIVKFNMLSEVENATLNLNLKLLSENTVSATLYCVQNEYGIFISCASMDDAYEKYYTFAKANGFMTEEECRQCRNEYIRAKMAEINGEYAVKNQEETDNYNAPIKVSRAKSKDTYVSGYLQWKDDDGNNHPLRGVKVEVYDEDTNTDDYVGTTYTDDNGYYFLTFQNKDGAFDFENKGLDLYIRVFAEDSGNLKVTRNDGSSYSFDSTVYDDVRTGTNTNISFSGDNAITMNNDYGQALQIFQALYIAKEFAKEMMCKMPTDLILHYPGVRSKDGAGCYYKDNVINIVSKNEGGTHNGLYTYSSWDVIMHEYGHHIAHEKGIDNSPGGQHESNVNHAENLRNKYNGICLAWSESWATVFSTIAQDYYKDKLNNIMFVGDTAYTSYNGAHFSLETNTICKGDSCEESVIAVLWDIYDSTFDINDSISLGARDFWEVSTINGTTTFSQFINNFYNKYPNYADRLGLNLSYYGMAPKTLQCFNLELNELPAFFWDPNGGSQVNAYNNCLMDLIFYNERGEEILKFSKIIYRSCELKASEWNTILAKAGDCFYWTVGGYNDNGFVTGPYYAARQRVVMPNVNTLMVDILMSVDNGGWYKFTTQSSGVYEIYTSGDVDTYCELYTHPVYGSSTEDRLAYDDNSGINNNFKITYTLGALKDYYLKVRANGSGSFLIGIVYVIHVHDYTYRCVSENRDKHTGYCYCGDKKSVNHTYDTVGTKYMCIYCHYLVGSVSGGGIMSVGDDLAKSLCGADRVYALPEKRENNF